MEEQIRNIGDLSIEEREDVFVDVATALEGTAREAFVEGNRHLAALSANMAQAIRVNADELARDDLRNTERILQQGAAMISQFNATHPYRIVGHAVH
ncbi:hypothetical protein [Rhizobium laguerreae]|uniref:hypothetical protein n=1 Tax=Rhizobium laguerreae TaxID=1076926 RepID=UPI0014415F64|nr:hypothetical protein [Rhizobium laguerreae]NKM26887.1 hypothetical protein [Rhizobium laguerreae]